MKDYIFVILLISVVVVQAEVPNLPLDQGEKWAILIGINQYQHWDKLKTPKHDVRTIKRLLLEKYGYQKSKIIELIDGNATEKKILEAFSELHERVGTKDSLFIYYAGHGDVDSLGESMWIPYEAKRDDRSQMIDTERVKRILKKLEARHVFLVADSCFSGEMLRNNAGWEKQQESYRWVESKMRSKSRQALTSGANEPVLDQGRNGHSAFAYHFIKHLEQNQKKYFSATALSLLVEKNVVLSGVKQSPQWRRLANSGDQNGEFFFVMATQPNLTKPISTVSPMGAVDNKNTFIVESVGKALLTGDIESVRANAIINARLNAMKKVRGVKIEGMTMSGIPMHDYFQLNTNAIVVAEEIMDWNILNKDLQKGPANYVVNLRAKIKVLEKPFFRPYLLEAEFQGGYSHFRPGEEMKLKITAHADVYIIVANYLDKGDVSVIYPNTHQKDNYIKQGNTLILPDETYGLKVKSIKGRQKIEEALLIYAIPKNEQTENIVWTEVFRAGRKMQYAKFQKKLSEIHMKWLAKQALVYTIQ